jgi:hypothetical protein
LIVLCAVTVAVGVGATAVAMAVTAGGPQPRPASLAQAVHDALSAPALPGVSADIQFTNHLVDAASLQGSDPLITGASGRLWASPANGGMLRLELQSSGGGGDSQVLIENHRFEIYDGSGAGTVYEGTLPQQTDSSTQGGGGPPSLDQVEQAITKAETHVDLSGAIPSDVAGQPTYTVRLSPKHDGGLLGRVELAWDANNGVPLRAAVYASGDRTPVLELTATNVSFARVDPSVFAISPAPGAKVVNLAPAHPHTGSGAGSGSVTGAAAVQQQLPFALVAPSSLVGLPQGGVRGIEVDGKSAALVTYGRGLGAIAVVESQATAGGGSGGSSAAGGLSLPKVLINGVHGEELDTALGTVIHFSRGGVDYLVLGSVPPVAAEAAARGL